jgi:Glycosyltransferase
LENKKKHIMLIVPMLDQGGLERVCATTAQLLKKEYAVHLVVFNTTGMIYDVSGVDMTDLKLGAVDGRIGKAVNVLRRVRRVKQLKKQFDIQLSYSFGPTANLVNVLSKQKDFTWAGIRGYGALSNKTAMKLVCRLADRVISCTRIMEQQIDRQFRPKRSAAVYNPCDIEQIRAQSKQRTPKEFDTFFARSGKLIASMGREHDVKGFWHLIKAVHLVRKHLPETRLMIIGAGDYSSYKTLAKQLGMQEAVLFTGVQANPFSFLRKADVYALTSESEGFPNALIEAMAVGIPCVSANCLTGPAEILHEQYEQCMVDSQTFYADYGILTGIFHGQKDMDAQRFTEEEQRFAMELETLLEDEQQYQTYREAALKRAETFGMEQYLCRIRELIETDLTD